MLSTPFHTYPKQNLLVWQSRIIQGNLITTSLSSVVHKCYKTHYCLQNLLLDSTLCSKSLKLLVISSRKMLRQKVTMVLGPFTRHNLNNSAVYSSCECLLSEATGNSDSQNAIFETTDNASSRDIEVRKKLSIILLANVWSQRLRTYTFKKD